MLKLLIKDYISSLKERKELDFLFPILLDQMGYSVLKSASSSHGQPEYGKDIVATKEYDGKETLYIFQLKAGDDKDINKKTFSGENGIGESLKQAKYVKYSDRSIPGLNDMPKRYVLVHNGELQSNYRPVIDGFVEHEFPDGNLERWDIEELSNLFSKHLLNEYIIVDPVNVSLLKKSIAFIDVPENDFSHFKNLVIRIIEEQKDFNLKKYNKMSSTLCMICQLVYSYSKESNNLVPARECLTFALLNLWGFILEHKKENDREVLESFTKLHRLHFLMMEEYLFKIIPVALKNDGLFSDKGREFEEIGYPLRSFDFISYYAYHLYSYIYAGDIERLTGSKENTEKILKTGAQILQKIIESNSGLFRPLLDNHSIPIVLTTKYLYDMKLSDTANGYITGILNNIHLIKISKCRLPELYNNLNSLIEYSASLNRPASYFDKSSYLLLILLGILTRDDDKYEKQINEYFEFLCKDVDLLTYYPPKDIVVNEHILFKKELTEEGYSSVYDYGNNKKQELEIKGKSKFEILKYKLNYNETENYEFRTDKLGLKHLRYLAHIYYKTPLFPQDWRE